MSGSRARVLLVSDAADAPLPLLEELEARGLDVSLEQEAVRGCARLRVERFDALLAHLESPGTEALALLRAMRRSWPDAVAVFAFKSTEGHDAALQAVRAADCVLVGRCEPVEVAEQLGQALASARGGVAARSGLAPRSDVAALQLLRAATRATSPADLQVVRRRAAAAARYALRTQAGWVVAWEQRGVVVERAGRPAEEPPAVADEVRTAGRPVVRVARSGGWRAAAPVRADASVVAAIGVDVGGAALPAEALDVLEALALQLELAERAVRTQRAVEETVGTVVQALERATALRSGDDGGRTRRVADLAERLALRAGVHGSSAELSEIRHAAVLREVGLLGLPDAVIARRTSLDERGWAEWRSHPERAATLLAELPGLRGVAALVRAWTERWDGQGYPRGLAGEAIPRGARLIAIADAWEETAAERAYDDIRRAEGTRFQPGAAALLADALATLNAPAAWRGFAA